jgi:hypothetical protein
MANTISTKTYRDKYRLSHIDEALRKSLVAEKICMVDRSEVRYIESPYAADPTTVVQALLGTYSPADFTTTNDTLTVSDEFIVSEHIMDFQSSLSKFDLFASRMDAMAASVATAIDKYVLNNLLETGTGTYTTPVGGFTTASNINVIMSNLISQVAGFSDTYKGLYLVIENTDIPGFVQAQATNGFSFADAALNNGWMSSYMGVDIYVVRSGVFSDDSAGVISGTTTWTNLGHRVFGVKNCATYAAPRGIQFEEKGVSGKTGKEVVCYGYVGFKNWAQKISLTVDITLA